ncbi:transcription factor DICHOTOMA-like [Macadamia integrifolia]|uniref:transcription factor DICHOTOMA-like n=1 Tax=Macadamia integrifolia TaxID=60698 RepID=UPI001C531645|nr:transcription factor DICHOTOMA-like [Macadamia integrifolia]
MFLSNDRGSGSSTPSYANDHSIFTSDTRPPPPPNLNNDVSLLNSKLDPPPPPPPPFPFYHYPSSTFAEHDHTQLLVSGHLLPQHQLVTANTNLISEDMIDMAVSDKKSTNDVNPSNHHNYCASTAIAEKQNPQKKRSVKRDRHSKITTAQGVRDRRMRLSLDVAREFFGLQDLRGDDKPSKTIRWLLNQCKGPMKELARAKELKTKHNGGGGGGAKSTVSSTSECEVMSGIEENSNAGDISEKKALAKRRKRQPRKTNFHSIGKESREKARARARERTIEKIRGRESSSPSETGEESGISHSHEMKFSMAEVAVVKEPSSHFIGLQRPNQNGIEEAAVMTTSINSSPSSIFSFQPETAISQGLVCSSNNNNNNNNVSSYFGNWDIDSTRAHYYYPSTTGNIQDRISSSILTTSEILLPCHFSEVPNFGAKPNWEV